MENFQKTCVVTGANSGLGKAIALALAQSGAHVIMVCRHLEKGQKALRDIQIESGSQCIDLFIADLSVQSEVRSLAKAIHQRYSTLDVLINNAGLVLAKRMVSIDGMEMTIATNHLGPFLLTHLLLDLLKNGSSSRVINVSSDAHKWGEIDLNDLQYNRRKYKFMKVYGQSKLLMNLTTFEYARRLKESGVTFNCVHPGAVKSGLGDSGSNNLVIKYLAKLVKFFFVSPEKASGTCIYLALSPEVSGVTGQYFYKYKSIPASAASYDETLAKKVWDKTEKLLGL